MKLPKSKRCTVSCQFKLLSPQTYIAVKYKDDELEQCYIEVMQRTLTTGRTRNPGSSKFILGSGLAVVLHAGAANNANMLSAAVGTA
jgi:hypothetical protein